MHPEEGDRGRSKTKFGFPKAWTHLWKSANVMLKEAPTVSRHLAHRLVREGEMDISSSAKELLCQKCGELTWTSATRIRKRRRCDRGKRNRVLKRCQTCNKTASHAGSSVYDLDRHRVRPAVEGSASAMSALTGMTTPAGMRTPAATTTKKKKRKRGSKTGMNRRLSDSALARPSGLSTSFLFEDLGD